MKTIYKKNPRRILGYLMAFAMVFFTMSSYAQCDHSFNMYDSYGDGWNGSSVDVTVNGVTVVTGAAGANMGGFGNSGPCGNELFSASSGDAIDLTNWVSGSYTSEVSWDITDGDGTVIASGVHGGSGASTAYCAPPPTCDNSFNMYDSYGDGWNGSTVDVTVNGVVVAAGATGANMGGFGNSGPCGNVLVTVMSGDVIDLTNWTTGSYTSEVSWDITDAMGVVIASGTHGTAGPAIANCVVPSIIPGCMDSLANNYNSAATVSDSSCLYPPANNDCANAEAIACGSSAVGNNTGASVYSFAGAAIWYSVVGQGGDITVSTCGTGFDTRLYVFDACGGTQVAYNDDAACSGLSSSTSTTTFSSVAGTVYSIAATGYSSSTSTGAINISVSCAAPPVPGCTDTLATNYNPLATANDGSCTYPSCSVVGPVCEDFTSGSVPVAACPNGWGVSVNAGGSGWVVNTITPGYSAAQNGRANGTYAWIDFSGTDVASIMQMDPVDISAISGGAYLLFDYFSDQNSLSITAANTLFVEANDGSSWNVIDSFAQFTTGGWEAQNIDLTGYDVAGVVSLRFRGESTAIPASYDYWNDLLVDNICVTSAPVNGCTNVLACNYDSTANVDDGSCLTAYGCMDTLAANYDSLATCPDVCTYGIPGCTDPLACNLDSLATANDGSCIYPPAGFNCAGTCASGIGADTASFEIGTLYSQGPWANWTYDAASSTFTSTNGWRRDNAGTISSGTGPLNGAPSADGAYYLYCETSGQYGKIANLHSSCVDLSNFSAPSFIASINMFGGAMGTLNIDVSTDGGTVWNNEWTKTGDQGQDWFDAAVDLSAYSGQLVQVRMNYTSGTSFTGDCAIDFLRFAESPPVGCMDTNASNYDSLAIIDDGSCTYPGCTAQYANNYDPTANLDDGSCTYNSCQPYPFTEDWESGSVASQDWLLQSTSGASVYLQDTVQAGGQPMGNPMPVMNGNYHLEMTGTNAAPYMVNWTTEAGAFANTDHIASATICVDMINAGQFSEMSFDGQLISYYTTNGYAWGRVKVNGVVIADINGNTAYNNGTVGTLQGADWTYDMSAYSGTSPQITFEFVGRYGTGYSSGNYGCFFRVDDIALYDINPCQYFAGATSSTDVTCNGGSDGSVSASASGASGTNMYFWDDPMMSMTASVSGLSAGTYTCVVMDAVYGCLDTVSVVVGEPSAMSLSAVVGNECVAGANDGSIDLSVSGGTPCITVQTLSSHNATLAQNGSNGCHFNITNTTASNITITDFAQGSYTYSGANTITVYSMPAPYDHLTNTTTGTWSQVGQAAVTIPAGGSFASPVYSSPVVLSSPVVIPAGSTYGFYVGGTTTVSYQTATNAGAVGSSIASDGYISVSSGHGGTFGSGSFSPRGPVLQVGYGDPNASAYTFVWDTGDSTQDLSGLGAGTYSVTATDCSGCTSTASYTVLSAPTYGCMDATACNYNSLACISDSSCILPDGCTDSLACNYDPLATCDDGSCLVPDGCTDALALNYDSTALCDDGSCAYPAVNADCSNAIAVACGSTTSGNNTNGGTAPIGSGAAVWYSVTGTGGDFTVATCGTSYDTRLWAFDSCGGTQVAYNDDNCGLQSEFTFTSVAGVEYKICVSGYSSANSGPFTLNVSCTAPPVPGCTNTTACNYNSAATVDDGSCLTAYGCTDSLANNYDSLATCDDGSCTYDVPGCMDPNAYNYNPLATVNDSSCVAVVIGCCDPVAVNYNASANTCDNTTCLYVSAGCGDVTGVNLTDVIHDRVQFNWDDMNDSSCVVDQIRIRYSDDGGATYSNKTMGAPVGNNAPCLNTSKLVLNLTPSTVYVYDFKIWYQDGTVNNWHANGTFTTADVCVNATNMTATPNSASQTDFCWTNPVSHEFVRLQYRENVPGSSFSNIGGFGVMAPLACKTKNGLTAGTQYRVMWRTWCNVSGGPYRSPVWDGPVLWTQPTSIRVEGGTTINNLDVYPNPSRDIFNVTFTSEDVQDLDVRIINVIGEVVYTENLNEFVGEYTKQVDLATYTKGVYFLEITTDNGVINKKLILQ